MVHIYFEMHVNDFFLSAMVFANVIAFPDTASRLKLTQSWQSASVVATNPIIFCFLFMKNHEFALRANQWPLTSEKTFLFRSSQQLPGLRLEPLKGFLSWHGVFQGPLTSLVLCFQNYRETKTPSGVLCWALKSQDTIKNSWRKPWLHFMHSQNALFTLIFHCKKSTE